jgi:hypothetical protein
VSIAKWFFPKENMKNLYVQKPLIMGHILMDRLGHFIKQKKEALRGKDFLILSEKCTGFHGKNFIGRPGV